VTLATAALLACVVLATSFLSGIFGMAGGMVLLGALLLMLDVAPAMVLFGVTQMGANGSRAFWWRGHIRWDIVLRYAIGSVGMFVVMKFVAFVPPKVMIYLGLGLTPFLVELLPKTVHPHIERRGAAVFCGALIMTVQIFAGVGGNILDLFFQKSTLDRKTTVATKAATQVLAHLLRVLYFGTFALELNESLPFWVYAGAVGLALIGTKLATFILERMTDQGFRRWSRVIILSVSAVYLGRGLWLVLA
jgi:uncharacterized membrane protein YfcA